MVRANERLQEARRKAGFENASDAARAHQWNENTYRSHENAERGLRPEAAARYGRAFRVSTSWLLTGEGQQERESWKIINSVLRDGGIIDIYDNEDGRPAPIEVDLPVIIHASQVFVTFVVAWHYEKYAPGDLIAAWAFAENEVHNDFFSFSEAFDAIAWAEDSWGLYRLAKQENSDGLYTIFPKNKMPIQNCCLQRVSPVRLVMPKTSWSFRYNDHYASLERELAKQK